VTSLAGPRAAALAGVALLAIAIAIAVSHRSKREDSLPAPAGQWYSALAAPYVPSAKVKKSACGVAIGPTTIGVAHPVLPCGAKIYVELDGREVLTQVIDRGHTAPGRVFDVTEGLAKLLRLQGIETIRWRFAS
jgi:rare lipoprotein A (peptidoglycan hydrolase)